MSACRVDAIFCSGLIPDEAEIDAISSPIVFDHFGNTGNKIVYILSQLLDTESSKLFI